MSLPHANASDAAQTAGRPRVIVPVPRTCTPCADGCRASCDVFTASFRGREVLSRDSLCTPVAGNEGNHSIDYSHLAIAGRPLGPADPGTSLPIANTETQYGVSKRVKMCLPVITGALGSAEIDGKNWEHIAVGAAISGVTIVCGEDICGIDPDLELDSAGRVKNAPIMARRVEQYRRHHEGYGDMIVRMSVDDARLGVAEYVIGTLAVESVELVWGRDGGDESRIDSLEWALDLRKRGYWVIPDPSQEANQAAFRDGALKHFERHSRPGFFDLDGFMREVERVRSLGAKRVTLSTGACPIHELALAIKWASLAKLDLLTIDAGAGGMGLGDLTQDSVVRAFHLQAVAGDLCRRLAARGEFVPDIAIAGGFSSEDHIFKALALGAPFTKAVCMGRTLVIPGMVGRNIGRWLQEGGDTLPRTISDYGHTAEEIFVCYADLVARYGRDTVKSLPLGAIAFYTLIDKLRAGLQQLMAATRNFAVSTIGRNDLLALTPEAARISGIPCVPDAFREQADRIINA